MRSQAADPAPDNQVFGEIPFFQSSWDAALKIVSAFCAILFLFIAWLLFSRNLPFLADAVLLILPVAALFLVRGYSLTRRGIEIRRLLWTDEIPYAEIVAARDIALRDLGFTLRVFGNGGMLSYTGFFWSRRQGLFKCLANNFRNPVLVRTAKRSTLLSPDAKAEFLEALRARMAEAGPQVSS